MASFVFLMCFPTSKLSRHCIMSCAKWITGRSKKANLHCKNLYGLLGHLQWIARIRIYSGDLQWQRSRCYIISWPASHHASHRAFQLQYIFARATMLLSQRLLTSTSMQLLFDSLPAITHRNILQHFIYRLALDLPFRGGGSASPAHQDVVVERGGHRAGISLSCDATNGNQKLQGFA